LDETLEMLAFYRINASMDNKQKVTILIPVEMVEQLKQEAKRHQRSFNGELVWALQEYLERQKGEDKHVHHTQDQA
jgi:hypothetical protein